MKKRGRRATEFGRWYGVINNNGLLFAVYPSQGMASSICNDLIEAGISGANVIPVRIVEVRERSKKRAARPAGEVL